MLAKGKPLLFVIRHPLGYSFRNKGIIEQKTQNEDKQNKTRKISNMDPPKTWGEPMCSPRVNQFFFLIRHPLSYSYVNASVVKVWSMIEERKDLPDGEKIYLMEITFT